MYFPKVYRKSVIVSSLNNWLFWINDIETGKIIMKLYQTPFDYLNDQSFDTNQTSNTSSYSI